MLHTVRSVLGGVVLIACGLLMGNADAAGSNATPQEAIQTYLASLAQGDTATLAALVDGNMKARSYRLLTENPTYPDFLRAHYKGVRMTIETLTPSGEDYTARVRFDYPTSDSSSSDFVLRVINGQWKIVDEQGQ